MRSQGDFAYWSGLVPGDTSATLWTKIHPYEDLPRTLDPPAGWVQNTNNPPWTNTALPISGPGEVSGVYVGGDGDDIPVGAVDAAVGETRGS